ncbi:MAG: hypothetical protein JEZ09_19340 [Salinivirgaceae bacterium]|nr:hypothetical protein [Salinivirgaceae bacterium]
MEKINFDLSQLDENGLLGPTDGKVSIAYEFCIPESEIYINQVFAIDSSFGKYKSIGLSACKNDQLLIIGNTHNKNFKSILCELSKLEFVKEINQSYKE